MGESNLFEKLFKDRTFWVKITWPITWTLGKNYEKQDNKLDNSGIFKGQYIKKEDNSLDSKQEDQ